jgi:RNA polymerase sigma-70 factor (ECF subfamily)
MERYKGRAFGVAVGIVGNGDDALDVVQDSFIKAYYKLKEFRFGSNFYTWFYRLLVNQAIDRWRKSARSAEVPLDESWLSEEDSPPDAFTYPRTPEDLARNRELGDALQRAIASLPEYHRAVIVLREVEGMAYDEIAKTLGCSVGTVMSRLHYARGKLKEALKPHREG